MRPKKTSRVPRKPAGHAARVILFDVYGPITIKPVKVPGGRLIDESSIEGFWKRKDASGLKDCRGCYVFAIRAGKGGLQPWYVGKTKRSFEGECFTDRNINKYNRALMQLRACTPLLFLIAAPKRRGAVNKKQISEVEKFLTQESKKVNPRLLNKTNTKPRKWEISGVTRRVQGKPKTSTTQLVKMLEL
ncbi:MAG: hypothetical protein NT025_04495 [bacterium]|nr:hypothetical protein [bacterium]